ncbi:hypothetical protein VDG03_04025 [Xanthomonas campestris pv. raphani]|uniref:hypothetical protein n=1 Tax=Xanthomonas campestris TaxID=339 RepID=UPI002B22B3FC|nr:hypothetical protein [Xanthomonas campestris]MEA9750213.1 hypothetical protein [Xanthomonas campestris pv. raphani]MEA9811046.1 hypothetical protein [Xanthomonas campestris pv. raphani]MEB2186197.1 hypothetical protein [Xanthomonas campestris pv. campestris]
MSRYLRVIVLLMSCILAPAALAADPPPAFVDAVDWPANGEGWEAFVDLEQRLDRDFDNICGDTFCGGEFSDYQPLRFRCSVNRVSGVVRSCIWTFGASEVSVDPRSGHLRSDSRVWRCTAPLQAGTRLDEMYRVLAVTNPLFEPLPGGAPPIYDGLIGCL